MFPHSILIVNIAFMPLPLFADIVYMAALLYLFSTLNDKILF